LDTLGDLGRSPLSDREKAAVRFAEKVTLHHRDVTREDVDALLVHWDPGEAVEIACTAGTFNYLNRFAMALGLWPTKPGEGGPEDLAGDPASAGAFDPGKE
jgi:alkylhydroperoxidase family enzyme